MTMVLDVPFLLFFLELGRTKLFLSLRFLLLLLDDLLQSFESHLFLELLLFSLPLSSKPIHNSCNSAV